MRSTTVTALRVTGAVVLAALLLGACGGATESAESDEPARTNMNLTLSDEPGQQGGRITYGLNAETDGWNPTVNRWAPAGQLVARAIFDTLAAYDTELGWQPNLAEDFIPNDDYTVWTIELREGVTFHNGRALDGAAVAEVLNLLKSAVLTSGPFEPVESIEATGPLEVTVTMVEPWVNFPFAMTTQIGVVPEPEWLASGDNRNPIGTGPFKMVDWQAGTRLLVERNEDYWREGYPLLDEIEFRPIPDDLSRRNAFNEGQLDIMLVSNGAEIARFKQEAERGTAQVVNDPAGETSEVFVMLNVLAEPFDDPDARRALALATDRQTYIDLLGEGQYEPAAGPFPPSSPWFTETDYPDYDPEAARALVADVIERHGSFSFTLATAATPDATSAAQLLVEQWQAVGIEASIEALEQAQLIGGVVIGNYQATTWAQFDSPHPLGDSIWWHPTSAEPIGTIGLNFARNENPAIGAALDAARQTTDSDEELEYYQEVQRLLAEDIPYVWLYHNQYSIVAKPHLVNIVDYELPNGTPGSQLHGGAHPLFQVWIDRSNR